VSQLSEFPRCALRRPLRLILGFKFSFVSRSLSVSYVGEAMARRAVLCCLGVDKVALVHMFTCEIPNLAVAAKAPDVMASIRDSSLRSSIFTFSTEDHW
jgi:hypothetical protein